MRIEPATTDDTETLVTIWRDSVRATHLFLGEQDIIDLEPVVREQALPNLEVWVLRTDEGEAAGFMGLHENKLEALFLAPAQIGKGGGKQLVAHARSLKGPLLVDVNEQNPKAVGFYLANGFKVVGRSPTDGEGRPFPLLHLKDQNPP